MSEVHGHCDPAFSKVKEIIAHNITSGEELGVSFCVNIDGKNVVDLWGGYADRNRTKPWTENTITAVWSMSKCVTNLAALILIDRGLLDPSANVSNYWPEFAANGKEDVKVWHILTHSAGLPAWDAPISIDDVYNIDQANERLAGQAPWWTPGAATGYHAVTQGHLVSELVRRVTGKSVKGFISEEITGPLDAAFHIGVPEKDWPRVAELIPPPPFTPPPDFDFNCMAARAGIAPVMKAEYAETPEFSNAEMPAINGFGNARGIARVLSAISLGGTVDGRCFLSPETAQLAVREQISGTDLVLMMQSRFGMGFGIPGETGMMSWIRPDSCYWGGWGGSIAIMDVKNRVTICYAPSHMKPHSTTGDSRAESYVKAVYEAMGV
ncbi:hypothetical protein ASPWEDRAFT_45268 [Aspergillus wentii DTO 134E9]|uniref:Beta-lactamase-related domain-containing protein n=1 Tax=Aspergillus wentii DTO 134E9 TaxID=1073089 RepID=A0A1L9R8T7_ASPWE|nr:uncharacterized protein ASPWEDRAFT_45268 [Aspergillus wentii DTO 134E9]OJJ31319.1 hypothetical protein ASPWEDRAFT_45268 [Aspergillus wentii DTO 134E9]